MAAKVSEVVRILMTLARENQSDVARVLRVPQTAVSARLRGQTKWTVDDLEVLALHYGKPITVFFIDPDEILSPSERRTSGGRAATSTYMSRPRGPRTRLHRPDRIPVAIP